MSAIAYIQLLWTNSTTLQMICNNLEQLRLELGTKVRAPIMTECWTLVTLLNVSDIEH